MEELTREFVAHWFDAVRDRYRKSLVELFSLASSDGSIRRLRIERPSMTAAFSAMKSGAARRAFSIFHASEWLALVLTAPRR